MYARWENRFSVPSSVVVTTRSPFGCERSAASNKRLASYNSIGIPAVYMADRGMLAKWGPGSGCVCRADVGWMAIARQDRAMTKKETSEDSRVKGSHRLYWLWQETLTESWCAFGRGWPAGAKAGLCSEAPLHLCGSWVCSIGLSIDAVIMKYTQRVYIGVLVSVAARCGP